MAKTVYIGGFNSILVQLEVAAVDAVEEYCNVSIPYWCN